MIKLTELLNEIGTRIIKPEDVNVFMHTPDQNSRVQFDLNGNTYEVQLYPINATIEEQPHDRNQLYVDIPNLLISFIDINDEGNFSMTNRGDALEVFGNIMGAIQEWFKDVAKMAPGTKIHKISWNTKREYKGDVRRDKIYRLLIQKWVRSNGYAGQLSPSGQEPTIFTFDTPLIIE